MKPAFIFLLYLFCSVICLSQKTAFNRRDSSIIADPNNVNYDLDADEKSELTTKLPFEKIIFSDVRYDTSFVAINWQVNSGVKIGKTFKKKLNATNGLAAGLTRY